jgi:multiple sugar transport system substrate-binding protein
MFRRLALLLTVLTLVAAAIPALPAAAQDTVTVKYWHTMSDPETEKLEDMIAVFEEANPDINIEASRYAQNQNEFRQVILTALASGDPPDVIRMDIAWVSEFAELGALTAVDELIPDFDSFAEQFFPAPLQTNYWDGHYYGLPVNTNTQVLLYNREQLEEAGVEVPTTIDEFVEAACALSSGDERYGYAMGGTYFWAPAPLFFAQGGTITDPDVTTSDGYLNSEASVTAFEALVKLYEDGCMSPNLLGGGIGTEGGHADGLYSMIIDGPWMVDIYASNYPDFEVNFALVPAGPDGTSSVVGGEDVVLIEGSENEEAALKWMQFLVSEEYQTAMAEVGVIPTLRALTGNEALPAYFEVFMQQLETANLRTPSPHWNEMDNIINNAYQYMLRGEKSPQEALDDAVSEIDSLLRRG